MRNEESVMRIKRNLRLIDIYTIGMNIICIFPVIIPYYRDEIGIGFREFLIGEACFAATIILLDVPAGWISDMWQRKRTQALGYFFLVLGYSCLLIAHSFALAVAAQMIIGVGISLVNGTNQSILYESLLSVKKEGEYRRREGRRQAMCFYTAGAAGIVGGFIYTVDHHLPIIIQVISLIVGLIATCMLDEPERHRQTPERHPVMDILTTIKYALHGHKEIGFIIMFAASLFCSTKLIMWSQQPYYMALKIPEAYYGCLTAIGFLLGGASSHMSHLLDGKIGPYKALGILWAFALVICVGAGLHLGWHGVALLMFGGTCIFGMASPRVSEVINRNVDSARRATVISTQSLLVSVFFIPLSTLIGHLSKEGGIQQALHGIAVWLLFAGLMLAFLAARRRRRRR